MYSYFYNFYNKPLGLGLFNQDPNNHILTPADLSPNVWYDPVNTDGDYTVFADGTALSSVIDLGSSASNQSQGSGAAQPLIYNNVINGNPVLRFNGSQWMSAPNSVANQYAGAMSVFAVFSTTNAAPAPIQRFLTKVSSWTWSNATNSMQFGMFAAGTYTLTGTPIANNTFYITGGVYNGSTATDFYINTTKTTISANITMVGTTSDLYFGTRDGTQHFINGDIGIVLVFFRALQQWEVNSLLLYLQKRFNL